jgi:hypothetical protein
MAHALPWGVAAMSILTFVKPGMFEPETVALMSEAYEATSKIFMTPASLNWCSKSSPNELLQRQNVVSVILFVCGRPRSSGSANGINRGDRGRAYSGPPIKQRTCPGAVQLVAFRQKLINFGDQRARLLDSPLRSHYESLEHAWRLLAPRRHNIDPAG